MGRRALQPPAERGNRHPGRSVLHRHVLSGISRRRESAPRYRNASRGDGAASLGTTSRWGLAGRIWSLYGTLGFVRMLLATWSKIWGVGIADLCRRAGVATVELAGGTVGGACRSTATTAGEQRQRADVSPLAAGAGDRSDRVGFGKPDIWKDGAGDSADRFDKPPQRAATALPGDVAELPADVPRRTRVRVDDSRDGTGAGRG